MTKPDIAELTHIAQELHDLATQHTQLVADNAALNHQLRQAEDTRVTQLAHMAHEAKRPLNQLRTLLYQLQQPGADADALHRELDQTIVHSSQYLDNLITLSQLSIRRVSAPVVVDLSTLAHSIWQQTFGADDTHELQVKIQPDIILHTPVEYPQAILENLLENARKYTPVGGSINCTLRQTARKITLQAANTSDIPKEELEKIQQSFHRHSADTTGSGLGLAIVAEAIEAMGGDLEINQQRAQLITTISIPR